MTSYPQHIPSIPYTDPASDLQTLDIWLPRPLTDTTLPWIIYIHGGAWRDPLQDSLCIQPTLGHLFSSPSYTSTTLAHIAGIASLNYRLSPYPCHPTHPSSPTDIHRRALHPQHVQDVACGLAWLQKAYQVQSWIGVGHSCGATLLLQFASKIGLSDSAAANDDDNDSDSNSNGNGNSNGNNSNSNNNAVIPQARGPVGLILLHGIYHLPLLLQNHRAPAFSDHTARIYASLVAGAFGPHPHLHLAGSPVAGQYGPHVWPEGRTIIMCHGEGDELVEQAQSHAMCAVLRKHGWTVAMAVDDDTDGNGPLEEHTASPLQTARRLTMRHVQGSHDEIWQDGRQIASLIAELVETLN